MQHKGKYASKEENKEDKERILGKMGLIASNIGNHEI